jgi:hypothetical protein
MAYPHTGSILENAGRNTTRTGVSTNIIIQVQGNPIGAVQDISIDESRAIATIDEVGTDGHIDSVPQKSTDITGSCKRTRFDNLRLPAAFSRGYVHAAAQRIPFDIHILDIFAAEEVEGEDGFFNDDDVLITVIKNVWISKLGVTYSSGDFVITENMNFTAERIYSYVGNEENNAVNAAEARYLEGITRDAFEQQADRGARRGALDAAGLIRVTDS